MRRAVRWYRAKLLADPGWGRLLPAGSNGGAFASNGGSGPPVLLATSLGGYWAGTTIESLLAVALGLRGVRAEVLLCDGVLPACQACEVRAFGRLERFAAAGPQGSLCSGCYEPGRRLYEKLGLRVHTFGEHLEPAERELARRLAREVPLEEIEGFKLEGASVGDHAKAGALRFFARGDFREEPLGEPILRRYFEASLLTTFAARRLFQTREFRSAVFHHGIYVPQGTIGEAARRAGLRVVNWNPAYRKKRFIFSHDDTYHHTLLNEPTSAWENMTWNAGLEREVMDYLKSRWRGTEDWIWVYRNPEERQQSIVKELGLDLSRPVIGLLTNVLWDAQIYYGSNAYPTMLEWLLETIRHFSRRPEIQLVIRVHPAEVHGTLPSRQKAVDEINKAFPTLPPNIRVVRPESDLSTYAIMSLANAALIYGTKAGVELAATGLPVIVAGEAWVRNKGFTHDASSAAHYLELLSALPFPERMAARDVERARKYAYHFFFRRMIPLDCMEATGGDPPYRMRLSSLDELAPGRMPGLDVILDGILEGHPFIYPSETLPGPAPSERLAASSRGG